MGESPGLGRRIAALFTPYRAHLAGIALIILVTSARSVVSALLVRTVFDKGAVPAGRAGRDLGVLEPVPPRSRWP